MEHVNMASEQCCLDVLLPDGSYCLLPRILFYTSLLFALIGWGQNWLIGAALLSALLYSSCAAIHMCLLAWIGPAVGECDLWPLVAIICTSAIVTVPLLNWSKTVRQLDNARSKDAGTRKLLIYWGFLIAVAFFSLLFLISNSHSSLEQLVAGTNPASISCTAFDSDLNATSKSTGNNEFYPFTRPYYSFTNETSGQVSNILDAEFVKKYNCINVCQGVLTKAVFRSFSDFQPISATQLPAYALAIASELSEEERQTNDFEYFTYTMSIVLTQIIVVQGIWAAFIGRRNPRQVRNRLYVKVVGHRKQRWSRGRLASLRRKHFAKVIALTAYIWAVTVTILCFPVLLVTIVAIELYIQTLPQSQSAIHIGAWTPWATSLMGLFAAIVSHFHYRTLGFVKGSFNKLLPLSLQRKMRRGTGSVAAQTETGNSSGFLSRLKTLPIALRDERKSLVDFWRNPDSVVMVERNTQVVVEPDKKLKQIPTVSSGSCPVRRGSI